MKANSHDSISVIECFLDPISVMNINIQIEYSGI